MLWSLILNIEVTFFLCNDSKARHFNAFILLNQLVDLGFSGPQFTWCNYQNGLAR